MNFKLEELTKDNEAQYLEQVANLEQVVMENMEARGQSGQLFPTGREDISAYAHSKENSVFVAVDENGKVKGSFTGNVTLSELKALINE